MANKHDRAYFEVRFFIPLDDDRAETRKVRVLLQDLMQGQALKEKADNGK